jgi:hypothetical protein
VTDVTSFENIRALCRQREVDLVMTTPPAPYVLCLHGQFDGHGDFFSILLRDVEYVELSGGVTVGDMLQTANIAEVSRMAEKWSQLAEAYSGPAIVIRSADSENWESARPQDLFLVVANDIMCRAGADFEAAGRR